MAEKKERVRRHALPYFFFGLLLGIVLVLIVSVIWLVTLNTPITLSNLVQIHLLFPLFLFIDILIILGSLIFLWVGVEKDRADDNGRQIARLNEQHQGEIHQINAGQADQDMKHEAEIAQFNEKYDEQERKFQDLEATIRHGKQQWEATFDAADDLIVLTDEAGCILRCNRATGEVLQLGYSQIIGRGIDELLSNGSESLLLVKPDENTEMKALEGDVWYEISKKHLLVDGQQEGWVYVFRNITTQKQALQDQQRLTHYYELLVNNSPVAILTLNAEDRIIDCNPAFESLFQYGKREALGSKTDLLIAPTDLIFETRGMAETVRQGEPVHRVTQRRRKDGSVLDVEVFGIPVILNGKRVGSLGLYHDVSELVRARKAAPEGLDLAPRLAAAYLMSDAVEEKFSTPTGTAVEPAVEAAEVEQPVWLPEQAFEQAGLAAVGVFQMPEKEAVEGDIDQPVEGAEVGVIEQTAEEAEGVVSQQAVERAEVNDFEQPVEQVEGVVSEQMAEETEEVVSQAPIDEVGVGDIEQTAEEVEAALSERTEEQVESAVSEQMAQEAEGVVSQVPVEEAAGGDIEQTAEEVKGVVSEQMAGQTETVVTQQPVAEAETEFIEQATEQAAGVVPQQPVEGPGGGASDQPAETVDGSP